MPVVIRWIIAFRNLADLGYNEAEIKAIAAEYEVVDGPNDEGEMFTRPAIPADRIPSPYPNENAARTANNEAYPPDLSDFQSPCQWGRLSVFPADLIS